MRESPSRPSTEEANGKPRAESPQAPANADPPPLQVAVNNPARPPRANAAQKHEHLIKRQAAVLQVVAEFLDQNDLHASLLALTGELQNRFRCNRVVVGLYNGRDEMDVAAVSQQASFEPRSAEIRRLADAMVEACDQDAMIHFPGKRSRLRIVDAHRTLAAAQERTEICTLPLCHDGETVGAILFERTATAPWSSLTLNLFRQIAALIAPLVVLRRQSERSLGEVLVSRTRRALAAAVGPRHVLAKTSCVLIIAALVAAHFTPVTHRVTADGELVPTERRVITAPIMGYIETVNVRPGEQVTEGDELLSLDTRDLELERNKWENEIRTTETEFRSAMAGYDRKAMAVAQARQRQAQAQLDLIAKQISRATVTAPADGIVVSGDLTQALGAPVELGETLLEIAPGEDYEVHLLVDEVDIEYISPGQNGRFALTAAPGKGLRFEVTSVHPIAEAVEGSNVFRVKTRLDEAAVSLRPGQTGVGKVEVGQANLLWVWTHRFTNWIRLKFWALAG